MRESSFPTVLLFLELLSESVFFCYLIFLPVLPILRSSEASNSNFSKFNKFLCGLCFCTQCWSSLLLFTVASLLHSLLFPFLWIWPSNDVCLRAYITRTDGGGVWWVLWNLVALTVSPCLPGPCLFFYVFLNLCFPFQILCLNGTRFLPNWHKFLWLIAATYILHPEIPQFRVRIWRYNTLPKKPTASLPLEKREGLFTPPKRKVHLPGINFQGIFVS